MAKYQRKREGKMRADRKKQHFKAPPPLSSETITHDPTKTNAALSKPTLRALMCNLARGKNLVHTSSLASFARRNLMSSCSKRFAASSILARRLDTQGRTREEACNPANFLKT